MELRHLRYFVALSHERHFGRAAQRLHVVQSALSVQIKDLEEEIGAALYQRTSRSVVLTPAGVEFLGHAEAILGNSEEALRCARMAAAGQTGRVRIGFSASAFLDGSLSAALARHHVLYPRVDIELQECPPAKQIGSLLEGNLDLCLTPDFGVPNLPEIEALTLCRWRWCLAMSIEHPCASGGPLSSDALKDEVFIRLETMGGDAAIVTLLGYEPTKNRRVGGILPGLAMIAAGLGVAFLPAFFAQFHFVGVHYREYPTSENIALQMLNRRGEKDASILSLRSLMRDVRGTEELSDKNERGSGVDPDPSCGSPSAQARDRA